MIVVTYDYMMTGNNNWRSKDFTHPKKEKEEKEKEKKQTHETQNDK